MAGAGSGGLVPAIPDILLVVTRQNVTDITGETQTEKTILERLVRDLGPALADHLVRANELDMSLHQIADALLTRRLAEHGVDVTLRNAYADARKEISDDVPIAFGNSLELSKRRLLWFVSSASQLSTHAQ